MNLSIYSQDLEPGAYANVVKDLNVVAVGYGFVNGNVLTEPSLAVADFTIQIHNLLASYIRTFGLANKLVRVQPVAKGQSVKLQYHVGLIPITD
ncbi:hypothetical protein [Flavobacterium poyangense]|uniref:hypothetical protein n=1 Tax=Flavobacterium poyangense TaxID=2204302 RepID=UPI001AB029AE|nr:hypothetical protein [Flavobacterium sp. JXAS1]